MDTLPTPEAFFLETSPYQKFQISGDQYKDILRIEFYRGPLDSYCPGCDRESVFVGTRDMPNVGGSGALQSIELLLNSAFDSFYVKSQDGTYAWKKMKEYAVEDKILALEFRCTRSWNHKIDYIIKLHDNILEKIGQSPSLADLQEKSIKKYRKILGPEKSSELVKAVGLNAHGVGIGSFIYLRRIFEDLIEIAHKEASQKAPWDEDNYIRARMDEKILLLKDHLPNFLVENRKIYSILSIGVHALSEQDCLKYFEPVKLAIEIILDEKLEQQERLAKESMTKKALAAIKSQLGANNKN